MTAWHSITGPVVRPIFNLVVNSHTAYFFSKLLKDDNSREIAIIVTIDTLFRIAVTHALDALQIPYLQTRTAGHLLFPCLSLLTQPLSVAVAQGYFHINTNWNSSVSFMKMFGYIALGWKANMMLKDVVYLCCPRLHSKSAF